MLFPHRVEYRFSGPVTVEEVIGTLRANQVVTEHLGTLLEELYPGLHVSSTQLRVNEVALGSLKELFTIALIAVYQKELEREVPLLISNLTGTDVPPEYNTLVTYSFLLLLYYGADFLHKLAIEKVDSTVLRDKVDVLISELSRATGRTEAQIKRALEAKFDRKSKLLVIGRAAYEFFYPSRSRSDEPIIVDELTIEQEVIKAVPKNVNLEDVEDDTRTKDLPGVDIEIRATDVDKDAQGWAGIVRTVSDKRMTMRLYPGVDREALRQKVHINGDIIVIYKDKNGELKPTSFHLVRVNPDRNATPSQGKEPS